MPILLLLAGIAAIRAFFDREGGDFMRGGGKYRRKN
jgi:hypothetical protein